MIRSAAPAKSAAARKDSAVWQQDRDAVVRARNRLRRHNSEPSRGRIPELRAEDRSGIGEGLGMLLAAHNEDLAVRKHDTVAEGPGVRHVRDALHHGLSMRATTDVNRVRATGGLNVDHRARVLVCRRAAERDDLAYAVH